VIKATFKFNTNRACHVPWLLINMDDWIIQSARQKARPLMPNYLYCLK
jgi:hypothetical protein